MINNEKDVEIFSPSSQKEWRQWLKKNHSEKQSVWLIRYRKNSGVPSISWGEAVDEALCFGWIDSIRKKLDDEKFIQFFSKRKPRGTWSKINKEKIVQLIADGRMTQAGMDSIVAAKKNGSWTILDEVEELIIPKDLRTEFNSRPGAEVFFIGLSKSVQKTMLQWVALARRSETRQNRILEIAECAARKQKPKQF